MFKTEVKVFIRNIVLTVWILSAFSETHALTSKEQSTAIKSTTSKKALVLCICNSGEIMGRDGQCQLWEDGTNVPVESVHQGQHLVNTKQFNVTIHEPQCQNQQQFHLQQGQFTLRNRGDILVTEGDFLGLRLSDYCVHHQLSEGKIKTTARGCVSVPVVPRCCEEGKYMQNGTCVLKTNKITRPFAPPLATGPMGDKGLAGAPFPMFDRREYVSWPSCSPGFSMKKIKLDQENTYLFVIPQNVLMTFAFKHREYISPTQYCVDGPENEDTYFAYYCEKDFEDYCKNKTCINKCCPFGQSLSMISISCVPTNASFKTLLPSPNSMTVLHGYPKCSPATKISNFKLSPDSTLITDDSTYSFDKHCIDNFVTGISIEPGAIACIEAIKPTLWHNVRKELFPICLGISCAFLILLLILTIFIPKLREKEDSNLLFHASSLLMAYFVTLIVQIFVPMGYISGNSCIALAFVMQFAFLSAFFWLNTMCFDMWRLSRSLVINNCSPVPSLAVWKYILYAFGGPLIITMTTIIIQFTAPVDGSMPGLIHPGIGEGRCWFKSREETVAYFYGPIIVLFVVNFVFTGIAYYYLRIIRGDYKSADNPKKTDFFRAFWQRFYLLVFIAGCWLTEILSLWIPPEELWAATDILNNLQGVLVFLIFLSPRSKRKQLKEKLQRLPKLA